MGSFIINGGKPLSGVINVGGSKNAALPIIFSCIAIEGVSVLENLPEIGDVDVALDILSSFGATVEREGGRATVDTRILHYAVPDCGAVSRIRASTYLMGATLSRFGRAEIMNFGGCNFDKRPIDMHIKAAESFGARLVGNSLFADRLTGCEVHFEKISVGATVNALIMASTAFGETRIYGYAKEPHVVSLADFLKRAGTCIDFCDDYISVHGSHLSSSSAVMIPDMIEAGTYLALSLMTGAELSVKGAPIDHLDSFLSALTELGAVIEISDGALSASPCMMEYAEIKTAPYPAFPTDLQPQMAPLLACGRGGIITETVWYNRFGYLSSLSKFGVEYELFDGLAVIKKSKLRNAKGSATDLRGGAAMLMAALYASGESVIENSEMIKRGYAGITEKLRGIGADIIEI